MTWVEEGRWSESIAFHWKRIDAEFSTSGHLIPIRTLGSAGKKWFTHLGGRHVLLARSTAQIGVDQVAYSAPIPRLEHDTGQSQLCQFGAVPCRQATDVDQRIGRHVTEDEFAPPRRPRYRHVIDCQTRLFDAAPDLGFVPPAVAQVAAGRDDLRSASQVVAKPQCSFHQLQLEKVKGSTVVRVKQKTVGLVSAEFQLERAVKACVPFAELGVRRLGSFQRER